MVKRSRTVSRRRHRRSPWRKFRKAGQRAIALIEALPWRPIGALSLLVAGSFLSYAIDRSTGGSMAAVAARVWTDPRQLFDRRSPGEREAGALTQTKMRVASTNRPGPHERVLSVVRDRPMPLLAAPLPAFGDDALAPAGPLGGIGPVAQNILSPQGRGPGGFTPGPSTIPLSPITSRSVNPAEPAPGTNTNPQTPSAVDDNASVPAVPEPATWAMLLVGFFAIGNAMRRRARVLAPAGSGTGRNGKR